MTFREFMEEVFPMCDEEDINAFDAAYKELDKRNRDFVPGVLMPIHLLGVINFFLYFYGN